jgi:multidrug efflux system outer membrane protein
MVGPDYTRPAIDAPKAFIYEVKDAADTANTQWWKQFNDPVLDQLIAEALANNLNVKVAVANVEQAAGVLTQTRSSLFPQVGYNGTAGRGRVSESTATPQLSAGIPNPQSSYEALLSASWEIDLWGRIRRLSEAARGNLLATDEARRGVILSLVASVAGNYLTLRGLDEQLVISKSTLSAYGESVRLYKLQFQYGQVSQMQVSQVQSQYETAAVQIPLIESQIAQTENALSVLIGRNPGPIPRGKTVYDLVLPKVPAGVPSELLTRRPDLLQAEDSLIAANAQIGAARALYFPTISLTGAGGSSSSQLSNLFTGPARVWNYAGQLVGPIFSFGAVSGQVAQAEAAQKAAVYNYQYSIQNAFADVENSLVAEPETDRAAGGAGAPGERAQELRPARHAAVQRRLHVVHDGAARRAVAVPGRTAARVAARLGILVQREHLQGDGRRLGGRGRPHDRRHRAATRRSLHGHAAAVLGTAHPTSRAPPTASRRTASGTSAKSRSRLKIRAATRPRRACARGRAGSGRRAAGERRR